MPRTTDWRSPQAVDALLELDRADLAWEFLRRNPDYREDLRQTLQRVATGEISEEAATLEFSRRWGYPVARDPHLAAKESPTIWRPELIPLTVVLVPAPEVFSEAHELTASDFAPTCASVRSIDGIQLSSRTVGATTACGFANLRKANGSPLCCHSTTISGFAFSA